MLRQLVEIKQSTRKRRFPVLAGLCVGIPILGGYFKGHAAGGTKDKGCAVQTQIGGVSLNEVALSANLFNSAGGNSERLVLEKLHI